MPITEFAYNDSVNRITSLSPFEIVTSFKLRQPVDLIPMAHYHSRVLDSASAFASHIRALHEEIREKIMKNNDDYKAFADLHCTLRIFNVDDCDGLLEIQMVSSWDREEIAHAKRRTISNPQEDQFKCLCGRPSTGLWH